MTLHLIYLGPGFDSRHLHQLFNNMQKLFENWREFRKDTLNEAKNVEYIGAFTLNDSPFLRQMYIVDGQAYYTSAGTGGVTRKGDLVQFGGILEVDVVPGPDGGNIATRLHRDQYISQIRKGGQSFGEVYRADWVLKNPAGKDVGDLSQDIRNLEAEKKGRIINKDDINKLLKKRGILRADWAVQHGLRHIDFPGVTKVKPRALAPSGLNRRERAKWRKDRHDKEWRDRAKGWKDDSLYPEKGFKKNDPKVQKLIDKELRLLGELPPEKTFKQFIIKYGTKIPIIGRFLKIAFATTIGSMVLLEAEKAYAKEGPIGAMKVIADNGADFIPVIGDIKGAIELINMLSQQDWNVPKPPTSPEDPRWFSPSQKLEENKLLFENWRGYLKENENQSVPEYLFPNARQDMLKSYEEGGINRQVFINKIERELMPVVAQFGMPITSTGIYEKFIFPQILKTIHETPVEIMGDFPCDEEAIKQAELESYPRRGGRHDNYKGKPSIIGAFHRGRLGAGKTKIYISCEYFPKASESSSISPDYDQQGTHSYGVFRHELMHAIDQGLAFPKQSKLIRWFKSGRDLDRWFDSAGRISGHRHRMRGMTWTRANKEIAILFPVTVSRKKGKGHSERAVEIYTNIIDLRARLGRPYQAEDVKKLKGLAGGVKAIVGLPSNTNYNANSDLIEALRRYVNRELTDQQIADLLNRVAAADKIKKPSYMQQTSLAENKLIISLKK